MISLTFNNLTHAQAFDLIEAHKDLDIDPVYTLTGTGADIIAAGDAPDVGTALAASPAAVFTAGVIDAAPVPGTPAAVFAASATPVMTALAEGFTYADLIAQGWDDQQLIEHGYMTRPNVAPAPPPAPAARAPAPPSTNAGQAGAASSSGAAVLLDCNGIPWDGRIHASTRTQSAKGAWKALKGVAPNLVASVEQELRGATSGTPFTPLNGAPPVSSGVQVPPPPTTNGSVTGVSLSEVPADFTALCRYTTSRAIAPPTIIALCQKYGMVSMGQMAAPATFAQFIEPLFADLQAAV